MPIHISFKQERSFSEHKKKLEEIISKGVQTLVVEQTGSTRVEGIGNISLLNDIEDFLLTTLREETNLDAALSSLKQEYVHEILLSKITPIRPALTLLKSRGLPPTLENFTTCLEEELERLASQPEKKYTYYVPTALDFTFVSTAELTELNRVASIFDITFLHISGSETINERVSAYFQKKKVVAMGETYARDPWYGYKQMSKKLKALFGLILLSKLFGRSSSRYGSDTSLYPDPIEPFVIIKQAATEVIPGQRDGFLADLNEPRDKIVLKRDDFVFLDQIIPRVPLRHHKLRPLFEQCLDLYLEAATEKNLEISFLKFWIILETMYSGNSDSVDYKKLASFIQKLARSDLVKNRIYRLADKRNQFVHKLRKEYIYQDDRDLLKTIAESFLLLFVDEEIAPTSISELKLIFDYRFESSKSLNEKMAFLKKISRVNGRASTAQIQENILAFFETLYAL